MFTKYSGIVLNIIVKVQPRLKLKHYTWSFVEVGFFSVDRLAIYAITVSGFYQVIPRRHA